MKVRAAELNLCCVYTLAAVGCVLIFLAFLDLPERLYPKPLLYFGAISYGLYVYHVLILWVVGHCLAGVTLHPILKAITVDSIGLSATIPVAACSYHFFELPFLKLKAKFTFVSSKGMAAEGGERNLSLEPTKTAAAA